MSDTDFIIIVAIAFGWGYGMARAMDYLGAHDEERRRREYRKQAYLNQRRVRLPTQDGPNA